MAAAAAEATANEEAADLNEWEEAKVEEQEVRTLEAKIQAANSQRLELKREPTAAERNWAAASEPGVKREQDEREDEYVGGKTKRTKRDSRTAVATMRLSGSTRGTRHTRDNWQRQITRNN